MDVFFVFFVLVIIPEKTKNRNDEPRRGGDRSSNGRERPSPTSLQWQRAADGGSRQCWALLGSSQPSSRSARLFSVRTEFFQNRLVHWKNGPVSQRIKFRDGCAGKISEFSEHCEFSGSSGSRDEIRAADQNSRFWGFLDYLFC